MTRIKDRYFEMSTMTMPGTHRGYLAVLHVHFTYIRHGIKSGIVSAFVIMTTGYTFVTY
jgi:hypothetical protein